MEWTKEQREQAQHEIALMELRHKPTFNLFEHEGVIDLQRKLTAALSEIERLKSEQMGELAVGGQKWISVEDDSPTSPEDCLVVLRGHAGCGYLGTGDKWHVYAYHEDDGLEHDAEVTHWQPLPAPPSGEQAGITCEITERGVRVGPFPRQDPKGEV